MTASRLLGRPRQGAPDHGKRLPVHLVACITARIRLPPSTVGGLGQKTPGEERRQARIHGWRLEMIHVVAWSVSRRCRARVLNDQTGRGSERTRLFQGVKVGCGNHLFVDFEMSSLSTG